jgi:hypothetical protein
MALRLSTLGGSLIIGCRLAGPLRCLEQQTREKAYDQRSVSCVEPRDPVRVQPQVELPPSCPLLR